MHNTITLSHKHEHNTHALMQTRTFACAHTYTYLHTSLRKQKHHCAPQNVTELEQEVHAQRKVGHGSDFCSLRLPILRRHLANGKSKSITGMPILRRHLVCVFGTQICVPCTLLQCTSRTHRCGLQTGALGTGSPHLTNKGRWRGFLLLTLLL